MIEMQKRPFSMTILVILLGLLLILPLITSSASDSTSSVKLDIDLVQGNTGTVLVHYTLLAHPDLQVGNWEYSLDGRSWQQIPVDSIKHSPPDFGLPTRMNYQSGFLAWQTHQLPILETVVPQLQVRVPTYLENTSSDWLKMPVMRTSRQGHSVTSHQSRLYAFGGWNGCRLTASAEFYDVETEGWYKIDAMPTPRQHLATVTVGGTIYAIGGLGRDGNLAVVEAYDVQLNRWSSKKPMPTERRALGLAVIDGLIYAIGGHNGEALSVVEIYDPQADQWVTGQPLPEPRHSMGVNELNGKIYVVGGINKQALNSVLVYSASTDQWKSTASLHKTRYGLTVEARPSLNRIYAIGGMQVRKSSQSNQLQSTILESSTFVETLEILPNSDILNISEWQLFSPLKIGRAYGGSGMVGNRLYAIGGNGRSVYSTAESISLDSAGSYSESQLIVLQNDFRVELKSPSPFTTISGNVKILGQVNGKSIQRWKLAVAALGSGNFQLINQGPGNSQSTDYLLGNWKTEGLPGGLYLIRLQAYHSGVVAPNSPAETFSLVHLRSNGT